MKGLRVGSQGMEPVEVLRALGDQADVLRPVQAPRFVLRTLLQPHGGHHSPQVHSKDPGRGPLSALLRLAYFRSSALRINSGAVNERRPSFGGLVADHSVDLDDVTCPPAGLTPRVIDTAVGLPILDGDAALEVEDRGAPRTVPGHVLDVTLAVPVPPVLSGETLFLGRVRDLSRSRGLRARVAQDVLPEGTISPRARAASMWSFFSMSACGE